VTQFHAILVPGGGLLKNGRLPSWTKRRLDLAIERHNAKGYIIALSAGTVYKPPPLNGKGFPLFESVAAAEYLAARGINPKRILTEKCSYDTIGNAYFSRVIHTEPRGWSRLLVITSAFHMPRTRAIFEWVYSLTPLPLPVELAFEATSDTGLEQGLLKLRIEKEKRGLNELLATKRGIHTLEEFHQWLYSKHNAYATALNPRKLSGDVLRTY